jgi:hypothetical protein
MITHRPSPTRLRALAAAALVLVSLAACSSAGALQSGASGAQPTPTPSAAPSAPSAAPSTGAQESPLPMDPTTPPGAEGVPPAALRAAIADAASRAGVDPSAVTVVSSEVRNWPDGSLGCPRRGFMYTQVITPGYRLVLEAGGTTYDYRGSLRGAEASLCENPLPGLPGSSAGA